MDTVASRDVPPPVLEFDGGISLVIAVKMPRSHENHVQNHWVIANMPCEPAQCFAQFGTVGDSPWPKVLAFSSTVKDPRQPSGSYRPRTESHGPHTGRLLAPYSPADCSCGCF